jgi:acetyl-CoA carboxylase biotin carboxyl carrier protein
MDTAMADTKVLSEVTGAVWKVLANVGDAVEMDAPVVLIESMKMEIPVLAPGSGTVTAVFVAVGDLVAEGDPVVAIRT